MRGGRLQLAESILRSYLERSPNDVEGMALLAETLAKSDRYGEASEILKRCLDIAPRFVAARHLYVTTLLTLNMRDDAFAQIDMLFRLEPENNHHHNLKAMAYAWVGDHESAAAEYEKVLAASPQEPAPYLAYAHTLRILGRKDDAVAAYRRVKKLFPKLGEPYWSLANLKTFRFDDSEILAMRDRLETVDLPHENRVQINFALGKAFGDEKEFALSFEHYKEGNALKRATLNYNAELTAVYVTNCKTLYSPNFLREKSGGGAQARDPIFVVGLPRSGSTLIEQILASHSKIEGTMELRILPYMVGRIAAKRSVTAGSGQIHRTLQTDAQAPYPEMLRNLNAAAFTALGNEYLDRARIHRVSSRPFFVDKMPDNFGHIGLIHLMLPNAKIIDARRHPLACCVSNFKQYFPLGKDFSYNLAELGRFYSDYADLMAHFDTVLPDKVHRVLYERLIDDPEREIRGLLNYLDLPFEETCLRFHETRRPIKTASSEQVRMPIFTDARDDWRVYDPWLSPLKIALGSAVAAYQGILAH